MPMKEAKLIWNEGYWSDRAEEARATSETMQNPECQRIMREIADSYALLARLTRQFHDAARHDARSEQRGPPEK